VINVIVLIEVGYLFNCRSLNHSLWPRRTVHEPSGQHRLHGDDRADDDQVVSYRASDTGRD
jgi:hypothetical protein